MKRILPVLSILMLAAFVLAACGTAATPAPTAMPAPTEAPTAAPMPTATEAPKDIVDIAVADGRFTTLVAALKAAGLVDTLKGAGPFTVFAPTDDAFKKLPAGAVDNLLKPENLDQLKSILLYHVVPGAVMAKDAAMMPSAKTVGGDEIQIKSENGSVMINDAKVIVADIQASNGVIHVIDTVLMPP